MGIRSCPAAELIFDGCEVPRRTGSGDEGDGYQIALSALADGPDLDRGGVRRDRPLGARAGGRATSSSGRPSGRRSPSSRACGSCSRRWPATSTAARALVHEAARGEGPRRADRRGCRRSRSGPPRTRRCGSRPTRSSCSAASGYSRETGIERLMRDAKGAQIYEGTEPDPPPHRRRRGAQAHPDLTRRREEGDPGDGLIGPSGWAIGPTGSGGGRVGWRRDRREGRRHAAVPIPIVLQETPHERTRRPTPRPRPPTEDASHPRGRRRPTGQIRALTRRGFLRGAALAGGGIAAATLAACTPIATPGWTYGPLAGPGGSAAPNPTPAGGTPAHRRGFSDTGGKRRTDPDGLDAARHRCPGGRPALPRQPRSRAQGDLRRRDVRVPSPTCSR